MMQAIKKVIDYLNIDFNTAWEVIPCDIFLLALKESFLDECMESEEGQEFLRNCERFKTKDLDVNKFRELKQEMEGGV